MQVAQKQPFKGIVYSLTSISGLLYIGSTAKLPEIILTQHWYAFKRHMKQETQKHMSSTQLFKEGRQNVKVKVLEQGYFTSKKDLQKLEGQHIKKHFGNEYCVNKYLTGGNTGANISERRKEYNKQYAARRQEIKMKCPKCKTTFGLGSWTQHVKRDTCEQNQNEQPVNQNPRIRRKLIQNQRSMYGCTQDGCTKEYPATRALINHENHKHKKQE